MMPKRLPLDYKKGPEHNPTETHLLIRRGPLHFKSPTSAQTQALYSHYAGCIPTLAFSQL